MRGIGKGVVAEILIFLFVPLSLFAFPDQEKAVLSLTGITSQAGSFVAQSDRFLFLSFGDSIQRIDTQTFLPATDQAPALVDNSDDGGVDLTGNVGGIAVRGDFLFATQSDGDLLAIDLNDITAEPYLFHLIDGALGPIVADPETGSADDNLYILDSGNNIVRVFNIGTEVASSLTLVDGAASPVSPVAAVFASFPTDSSSSTTDKIYITTDRGLVFVVAEGGGSVSGTITLSVENKSLPAAALTPGGDFLLVVNSTDSSVHVIDTDTDAEVDTDSTAVGTNPIALPMNGNLEGITITDIVNPAGIYAFVTGSEGVSVIELNIGLSSFGEPTVIDFSDTGVDDTDDDPMVLSSAPGQIIASSVDDGYLYTSNGNATVSVITENPFVVISTTSLADTDSSLTTDGTFTITFQSDETGTYRVLVGGDETQSGTEVASGSVDTADSDVTTAAIAYDAALFVEGDNRVFVFVTDAAVRIGRDAVDIHVDAPPTSVEIVETGFGNEKIFVTFTRLTASDIDHYNIYVDFDSGDVAIKSEVAGTLSQPGSGDTVEAKVTGLINGVKYYIGIEGVDTAGNAGPRTTTFPDGTSAFARPQETISLTEVVGEAGGCGLIPLPAEEKSPQWWSLEFKGGVWIPVNRTTRDFLGTFSPAGMVEFGFLYHSKFGAELGVGYVGSGGFAVGATSGAVSRDRFDFTMIPIQNSFTFRADFKEDQLLVPYVKAGPDYVIYRENNQGEVTTGVKLGLHGALGLQILLDRIEDLSDFMEDSLRVNDVYFVIEGRYAWIDNFGGGGLSLSNLTASGGLLFEF